MSVPGSDTALMRWEADPDGESSGTIDIGKRSEGPLEGVMGGVYVRSGDELSVCLCTFPGDRPRSVNSGTLDNHYILFRMVRRE